MESKQEYLQRLKLAVEHLHNCSARHCISVQVQEEFRGQIVWQGTVEVFDITGNPKAVVCYAWSHRAGKDDSDERFVAVLGVPPIVSPVTAVRASIVADSKK